MTSPEDHDSGLDAIMSTSFVEIRVTTAVDQALRHLAESDFALITEHGQPLAVLTGDQLGELATPGRGSLVETVLPALILVQAGVGFRAFLDSDAVTLLDLDPSAVVVVDGGSPVGVVTAADFDARLAETTPYAQGTALGYEDDMLPADAILGTGTRSPTARVACASCGYANTLTFYDRRNPPECQNPRRAGHLFRPHASK